MKPILFSALAAIFLICSSCRQESSPFIVDIGSEWKFSDGDHLTRANPDFDDSAWKNISITGNWDDQGYQDYDGIGWYRIRLTIPGRLRENAVAGDSIQIFLGKIDDADQVFLNGFLIGQNCANVAEGIRADSSFIKARHIWNKIRRYTLEINDPRIKWDEKNVLAVRCFDQGGPGGISGDRFEVSGIGMRDRVVFDLHSKPFVLKDSVVTKTFSAENISSTVEYQGNLEIRVIDANNKRLLYQEKTGILLTPKLKLEKTLVFRHDPAKPAVMEITFRDKATGEKISREEKVPYILTPAVPSYPRINGAAIFGVRPYSPLYFKVAATGEKPLEYAANGLPPGVAIDKKSGIISGFIKKKGEYTADIEVSNLHGTARRPLKIVCGEMISLTPPMGWNSWNCWGLSVSDARIREAADGMVNSGLIDHGWSYINIDDGWEDTRDRNGQMMPNHRFADMPALCQYIHSHGLKAGIYSSPGPKTCGGYEGSYLHEEKDAALYARWGMDYLKYDWCSYFSIAPDPTTEQLKKPYKDMRNAIRKQNRDIHYSLCQYGMGDVWKWGADVDGNSWRTTGDITDTWESMSTIGFNQYKCSPYAAPGRWNDPDMLVIGWVGWGPDLRYTRLDPDEQYTHITLWSMLAAPLLLGCDLTRLDPFTINLLTNDEVLAVNQDPLGQQASRIFHNEEYEVWSRDLADGRKAVAVFNKTKRILPVPVSLRSLCMDGKWMLRDLWSQQDVGLVRNHFELRTQPHGARMMTLTAPQHGQ